MVQRSVALQPVLCLERGALLRQQPQAVEPRVLRRQQEAREAREASKKNQQRKDQLTIQQGLGMKTVHDGIYKAKYVPQSSAEYLESSKYGKTTV